MWQQREARMGAFSNLHVFLLKSGDNKNEMKSIYFIDF